MAEVLARTAELAAGGSLTARRGAWDRFRRQRSALLGLGIVLLLVFIAVGAPVLATHDPFQMIVRLKPPSGRFWLGTDELGRDLYSRILYGTRVSLGIAVSAVTAGGIVGSLLGLAAGFLGRWVDGILARVFDLLFAFPSVLLGIAVMAALGPGYVNAAICVAIINIPIFARLLRAAVIAEKVKDYVEAGRALGATGWRLAFRTILPNCLSPLVVQATISIATAILIEAAFSFLGLGAQPPVPSWGSMLNEGRNYLDRSPWYGIFPGVAVTLAIMGFNLVGQGLRVALDPRARGGRGTT